ncbi:hypothetical protein [Cellulomonas composti]|uniref:Uncharacterized protein n=1 Tax=Cellulomonas composti TaxID=266130 RepID=A0A511JDE5_9CELL|nr:hypothetical protein [Cellulomonas composti]GEL95966.1 hypothetical protein CCO02nite_26240 [Cellulomonas composti]
MTTTHANLETRPSSRKVSWAAPQLAALMPRSPLGPILVALGAIACTVVDVLLMEPAVARVLRHDVALSWATAAGIGVVALLAAGQAGWSWRGARGAHPGSRSALVVPVVLLVAWGAGGLGIMAMRLSASRVSTTVAYEGATTAAPAASFDAVAAAVFLVVYVVCGVLAFGDLWELRNDAHAAGRRDLVELEQTRTELGAVEATYQQLHSNVHKRRVEIRRIATDARMARERNARFAAELKHLVRGEMVIGLGDPRRSGIASPRHPDAPHAPGRQPEGETR